MRPILIEKLVMSPSHVRTNIITCLYIFNKSNVFSWNFVLLRDETFRLNIAFNQPTSCRTALHLAHLEPGNVRTGRTAFAMVPWLEELSPMTLTETDPARVAECISHIQQGSNSEECITSGTLSNCQHPFVQRSNQNAGLKYL